MDFLLPGFSGEWASTEVDPAAADAEKAAILAERNSAAIRQHLASFLTTRNLMLLAGSGASLSVRSDAGERLAPSMADLWSVCKALRSEDEFEAILQKAKYEPIVSGENIEYLLSRCQLAWQFSDDDDLAQFTADAELAIARACDFISDETSLEHHETLLRKIARRSTDIPRAKIFTTNYDLCFETSASRMGFIVNDGFSFSQTREFDAQYYQYDFVKRASQTDAPRFIPNVFYLFKLHGSVDWSYTNGKVIKTESPTKPHLIYPQSSKYESSYRPPFFDVMSRFHQGLRADNAALVVIGFGFNDDHISEPILAAIRQNIGLKICLVAPDVRHSNNDYISRIRALAEAGDERISLINEPLEGFVSILPGLVSSTDEELHAERIRAVERS